MDRIFASGAAGSPPSYPASPSIGYPQPGNPSLAVQATKPSPWWFYMVTEEIRKVITDAGLTPDGTSTTQLSAAIQTLIANGAIKTPVRATTTANIATLGGGAPNTLDGVTLAANDRLLLKDQSTASQNGIYVVTTLGTGANGTWTRATDADGAGELIAGSLVVVQEGTTYADSVWELSTDGAITIGSTSLTFTRKDSASAGGVIQGGFKNLQASATGTGANVSVTADEVAVENASNAYQTLRAVSLTINSAGSGANGLDTGSLAINTWYSVWVIWNGTTAAGLLSLSATAPTMPGGYTHKARVGWIRTDASGNKYPLSFVQMGRRVQYKVAAGSNVAALPLMSSGAIGSTTTPTWAAIATGTFVPSTASRISGVIPNGSGTANQAMLAPNNAYGVLQSTTNPPPFVMQASGSQLAGNVFFDMALESTNIYGAMGGVNVFCNGWEDNL